MNVMNSRYKPCPKCTYPLTKCTLGKDEKDRFVIRTYCTNKSCGYEKITHRKKQ